MSTLIRHPVPHLPCGNHCTLCIYIYQLISIPSFLQDRTILKFEWTKDGQRLPISAQLSYSQPNISGTLSFDIVKATDSGEYSCFVRTILCGAVAPNNPTYTFTVATAVKGESVRMVNRGGINWQERHLEFYER